MEQGVVAGVSVVYEKWRTDSADRGGREVYGEHKGFVIEGIRPLTHDSLVAPCLHNALPGGYWFSKFGQEELQVMISRNGIPRKDDLARLGSVAIRYRQPPTEEGEGITAKGQNIENTDIGGLIVWAFLGVDGSPSSLCFKPGH